MLTDWAAFLQYQLYSALSVLHSEVEHPRLALYNMSGGEVARAKGWSGGRWRRGGWRWRGRWRNCSSCCCISCFWLAWRSIHAGLAQVAGKVNMQSKMRLLMVDHVQGGQKEIKPKYDKSWPSVCGDTKSEEPTELTARKGKALPANGRCFSSKLSSIAHFVTHVSHNTVNDVFFLLTVNSVPFLSCTSSNCLTRAERQAF